MASFAPYDPFPFLSVFFTTLGPEIAEWVKERTDARMQNIMMHRVKHLKRYCKLNKLKPTGILIAVQFFFKDLTDVEQGRLALLMDDELDL